MFWFQSRERSKSHKHKHSSSHHHKHKRSRSNSDSGEDDRRRRDDRRDPPPRRRDDRDNRDADERRFHDDRRAQNHHKRNRGGNNRNPFQSNEPEMEYGRPDQKQKPEEVKDKEKPNFEVSGKLAEETNTYKGIVIKYSEPPEARKPRKRWRLYPFKGDEVLKVMHIHRQSAYLMGRDRRVADIPIDHPSCSKQHAVLQYRLVNYTRDNGTEGRRIRPYIIDLGAANGTYLNGARIEANRYVELMEKDVLKFGYSSREYVVLTDKADTSELEENPLRPGEEDVDD